MLLIGDIHINARFQDKIIEQLDSYVHQHPDEKHIIFCGDFVYHFSYDRNALLALYHFFLELLQEGKHLYILAGNHDWLGNSFVFEEARTQTYNIEGQETLFLPYTIDVKNMETKKVELPINIQGTIDLLRQSTNKNELLSAAVNEYLRSAIAGKKDLLVIHHYYINNTKFPGQKSKFNYKDVALHEDILKQTNIKQISGHLHQSFAHGNYVCLGSVRSTTPLEANQNKFLFQYKNGTLEATQSDINPYIIVEQGKGSFSEADLQEKIKTILEGNKKNFTFSRQKSEGNEGILDDGSIPAIGETVSTNEVQGSQISKTAVGRSDFRNITFIDNPPELKNISLSIKTDAIDYQNIDEYIAPELRVQIKDIKLKKESIELNELLENFEISAKNLSTGFADWKDILKSYLMKKHGDEYDKYEKKLKELKLL
ncbi:MAG: metallophosphoesterase [candidate division SR1 bacterium]|nr:metallophosphoesterase [candidate division SR1 bacterium]